MTREEALSAQTDGDLISRQDAIEALGEEPEVWTDSEEEWAYRNAWVEHISALKALPSADRPTGEWIEQYDEDAHAFFRRGWICTYCGSRQTYGKPDFCPSCGAEMDRRRP